MIKSIDFAELGSALFKSIYSNDIPKVSLLNIGSEEIKGTELLKKHQEDFAIYLMKKIYL